MRTITKKKVKCKARQLICGDTHVACWTQMQTRGSFPHSPACQSLCLSASNRGTGEDRQHLLSKPNYLLSTKAGGRSGAVATSVVTQPHSLIHFRAQVYKRGVSGDSENYLLTCGNLVVRCTKAKSHFSWNWSWSMKNTSSAAVVPCGSLTVSRQRVDSRELSRHRSSPSPRGRMMSLCGRHRFTISQ